MFAKYYNLSITRNYVNAWGIGEACREVIQNALDSASPFVFEFIRSEDGNEFTLRLRSEFSELSPKTLLLGASSKQDDPDSIGSFGEGYKIALLVLTRLGKRVEIWNGKLLWTPRFRMDKTFGEEVLAIEEEKLDFQHTGLTYNIHGLTESEVELIRMSCLKMQSDIGEVRRVAKGEILVNRPGMLYVGSLFVCDTGLDFGYNIKPEFIKLERDRQTVSDWDLKLLTKDMHIEYGDFKELSELVSRESPDTEYVRYGSNSLVKEACYQHFIAAHPGKVIAANDKELQELVKRGMTVYVGGSSYYSQVSQSASYLANVPKLPPAAKPSLVLEEFLKNNRKYLDRVGIVAFKELINKSQDWKA